MLRLFLVGLGIIFLAPGLCAQKPLEEDESYQAGLSALDDDLPELAIRRFEAALATFADDESAASELHLRLGEASVRAAREGGEEADPKALAESALKNLAHPGLEKNESATYWSAQAFLALGRFAEATGAFEELATSEDESLRNLSRLALVRLHGAMQNPDEAIALLVELEKDEDAALATEARLLHASLLLDRGDLQAASQLLPEGISPAKPSHARFQQYLRARVALGKENSEEAFTLFTELLQPPPTHLSLALYHGAILGQAEALYGLERTDEAVEVLIQFLAQHPESPFLDQAFSRLSRWAMTAETLRVLYEQRLQEWSNTRPLADYESERAGENGIDLLEIPVGGEEADVIARTSTADATAPPNLAAYALYHYALLLRLKNEAESVGLARFLLARLRLEHPNHRLAHASLLETAALHNAEDRQDEALTALEALERLAVSPALKAEAAELSGYIRFKQGDFQDAAEAFAHARAALEPGEALLAARNQAVSLLRAGESKQFGELFGTLDDSETILALELESLLVRASRRDPESFAGLDRFIRENGAHRRLNEAQLALAEVALAVDPPDPEMARSQLDIIDTGRLTNALALRHLLARLRLAELTGERDWPAAIADATSFLDRLGEENTSALESGVELKLAEAYYQNGYYNKARRRFLSLASREESGRLQEVALFFAAKSALEEAKAGVSAEKSQEDALAHLTEVVEAKGPLAEEARLVMAQTLIESKPADALALLQPLLELDSSDPRQLDALVLAAQAYWALGEEEHYLKAIELYDRVLAREDLPYALSNRFHSLRGQTYERLNKPAEALDSYYPVIKRMNLPEGQQQTEWRWWEDCGFKALQLLESRNRWRAALQVARIIAAGKGARAEVAAKRAKAIQLKHLLWEDDE